MRVNFQAMLIWSERFSNSFSDSLAFLDSFITEIIQQHLVWRAGRNAESLRTMCAQVLSSIAQGAPSESYKLFPKLITHFILLCEDNNAVTRLYTLRCLRQCGPINYEDYKLVVKGTLLVFVCVSFVIMLLDSA